MILEMAILNVRTGLELEFEKAMENAHPLIAATPGFVSAEVRKCIEEKSRYVLLVTWENLEDHMTRFRQSDRYEQWRALLHHFYDPFPEVEHYSAPLNFADKH